MKNLTFNLAKYGTMIRKKRAELGYKNIEDFSAGVLRKTHIQISKDTLYRIEQGRQEPNVTQFIAINLTLFNKAYPTGYNGKIEACLPEKWREYDREEQMPQSWKRETLDKIFRDCGTISDDGKKCIEDSWLPDDEHYTEEILNTPFEIKFTNADEVIVLYAYGKAGEYYIVS